MFPVINSIQIQLEIAAFSVLQPEKNYKDEQKITEVDDAPLFTSYPQEDHSRNILETERETEFLNEWLKVQQFLGCQDTKLGM